MTRFAWAAGLVGLLASAAMADPDLTKLDRTFRKEPEYRTKSPRYCLLVFGPEARTKVWLVLDGNSLYVDRNGNGDLTEPGERTTVPEFKSSDHPLYDGTREVNVGSVQDGKLVHTELTFSQVRYRKTLGKLEADQQSRVAEWQSVLDKIHRQVPDGMSDTLTVKVAGPGPQDSTLWTAWIDHQGPLRFGDSPRAAPVVHFGGPLTMIVNPLVKIRPDPGPDDQFAVQFGTTGVGRGSFAYSAYDRVPKGMFPVAELEYPPVRAGAAPVEERYELKERC